MTARHEQHHALIAERTAAYRAMPRRSGIDRQRRREAGKRAVTTLRGHLSGEHGYRHTVGPPPSLEELEALHDRMHREPK